VTVLTITANYDAHADNVSVKDSTADQVRFGMGGKDGPWRTAIRFPLNDLPSGLSESDITQVRLYLYCRTAGGSAHLTDVHAYDSNGQTDPEPDAYNIMYTRCASGNLYINDSTDFRTTGDKWIILGGTVKADILGAKSAVNRFSFGVHEEGDDDTYPIVDSLEKSGGFSPKLEITYTAIAAVTARRKLLGVGR